MWAQTVEHLLRQHPYYKVVKLCELFGHTKQAYYKSHKKIASLAIKEDILLSMVGEIRQRMPRIGGRKLHYLINKNLQGEYKVGRDSLFSLLRRHGYLLRYRGYRPKTTNSYHHFLTYKNLIEGLQVSTANELYVSDITYISLKDGGFVYLSLITDVYSHKIVGWALSDTLDCESGPLKALQMALKNLPDGHNLIHHSDRGVQYCSNKYTNLLKSNKIRISMTQSGNPRENAVAERVNGILKMEWLNDITLKNKEQAHKKVEEIVGIYNFQRPHLSNQMLTPHIAHQGKGIMQRKWKNYYTNHHKKPIENDFFPAK